MPRSMNRVASRERRKKVLKRAKGFFQGRRKLFRTANETLIRAMAFATRDRKQRKRHFRSLWIVRMNAACRELGVAYSRLVPALAKAKIQLNRKSLAEMAVRDPEAFKQVLVAAGQVAG